MPCRWPRPVLVAQGGGFWLLPWGVACFGVALSSLTLWLLPWAARAASAPGPGWGRHLFACWGAGPWRGGLGVGGGFAFGAGLWGGALGWRGYGRFGAPGGS